MVRLSFTSGWALPKVGGEVDASTTGTRGRRRWASSPAGEDVLTCSFESLAQIDMLRVGEPLKMIKTNINPKSVMLSRYASTLS